MTAKKFTITTTFLLITAITTANILWPDTLLSSFAYSTTASTVVRIMGLVFLCLLMTTDPPRGRGVRIALAVMSAILVSAAVNGATTYSVGLLDSILYVELAIILAIEALEYKKATFEPARRTRSTYVIRRRS